MKICWSLVFSSIIIQLRQSDFFGILWTKLDDNNNCCLKGTRLLFNYNVNLIIVICFIFILVLHL